MQSTCKNPARLKLRSSSTYNASYSPCLPSYANLVGSFALCSFMRNLPKVAKVDRDFGKSLSRHCPTTQAPLDGAEKHHDKTCVCVRVRMSVYAPDQVQLGAKHVMSS
eukprot:4609050-Amphidinium_carterae.1